MNPFKFEGDMEGAEPLVWGLIILMVVILIHEYFQVGGCP